MNYEVMDALGNVPGFKLSFVGKGNAAEALERYAKGKGYDNVVFTGFYKKEKEPSIYKQHALVNIIYPLIPSHISALSNRFYNSLIYKRPMIVTRGTVQGDYAEQYGVGLVIDNCEKLDEIILEYQKNLDSVQYQKQCNLLLKLFRPVRLKSPYQLAIRYSILRFVNHSSISPLIIVAVIIASAPLPFLDHDIPLCF